MTPRLTTFGLVLLLGGVATLYFGDGGTSTVHGLAMLAPGAALSTIAGVRGITPSEQAARHTPAAHRGDATPTRRTSDQGTGRWSRVLGGG